MPTCWGYVPTRIIIARPVLNWRNECWYQSGELSVCNGSVASLGVDDMWLIKGALQPLLLYLIATKVEDRLSQSDSTGEYSYSNC
eukprot:53923-Rhodomonas_salina.2